MITYEKIIVCFVSTDALTLKNWLKKIICVCAG